MIWNHLSSPCLAFNYYDNPFRHAQSSIQCCVVAAATICLAQSSFTSRLLGGWSAQLKRDMLFFTPMILKCIQLMDLRSWHVNTWRSMNNWRVNEWLKGRLLIQSAEFCWDPSFVRGFVIWWPRFRLEKIRRRPKESWYHAGRAKQKANRSTDVKKILREVVIGDNNEYNIMDSSTGSSQIIDVDYHQPHR